jgi:hypothetical protein
MRNLQNRQALIETAVVSIYYKERSFLEKGPFRDTHIPKPGLYMDSKVGGFKGSRMCWQ